MSIRAIPPARPIAVAPGPRLATDRAPNETQANIVGGEPERGIEAWLSTHRVEGDPKATARALCEALGLNDVQTAVLLPAVQHFAALRMRQRGRRAERRYVPRPFVGVRNGHPVSLTFAQELLVRSFALDNSGKRHVTWGAATIEHHRERIKMLQTLRMSVQATIEQHESAIAAIREAGVRCLQEIAATRAAS